MSSQLWLHMAQYLNYICYRYIFISYFVSIKIRKYYNWTIWCGWVWRDKSSISYKSIYSAFILFYWHPWRMSTITGVIKITVFVYLLHSYQYVSNMYIMDRNPRLSSYMIDVTYMEYILLLLVCGDFPLTLKTVGCWNQLQLGFPWSSRVTNVLEYYLLFRIQNLKSGFAARLE